MAQEITCPVCQARLRISHDGGEAFVHCPSCLSTVPRPASLDELPKSGQAVPPVEAETRQLRWSGYCIALAITLLFGVGIMVTYKATERSDPGSIIGVLIILAFLCDAALTALILFPAGYALVRGLRPAPEASAGSKVVRRVIIVTLLAILTPFAADLVFVAVCVASLVVVNR